MRAAFVNSVRLNFDGKIRASCAALDMLDMYAEEVASRCSGYDILVTKELEMSSETIRALPDSVKMVCEAGTGVNNYDRGALKERGIELRNCPAYSTEAMASLVMTQVLNFSSSMHAQQLKLFRGDRSHFDSFASLPHFELEGKTLGLIGGNGTIGKRVSELALAFKLKVLVSSRSGKSPQGTLAVSLEELLKESDFVSIHCPLNDETRGMLDGDKIASMKPTAYLINTARGGIIDYDGFLDNIHKIGGAALDVQDPEEPPLPNSPLWSIDNVILTPHIGWKKLETRQRLMDMVVENIRAYERGEQLNIVQ